MSNSKGHSKSPEILVATPPILLEGDDVEIDLDNPGTRGGILVAMVYFCDSHDMFLIDCGCLSHITASVLTFKNP